MEATNNQTVVYDNRTAIPTDELIHLLRVQAEYEHIIRMINSYEIYEEKELGHILMKEYKVSKMEEER